MDKLSKKMKRASGKSQGSDKYQTLLKEFLDLQKEFVSRKKKLQAARQTREAVLAEVRFLRRRRKHLLKGQSSNTVPNSDLGSNAIEEGKRNRDTSEATNLDQVAKGEEGEGNENVVGKEVLRFNRKPKKLLIQNKVVAKRKISWHEQVTLKV